MTDYTELVKALRYCAENGDFKCGKDCPMRTEYPNCLTKMDTDAAAAIEALEARLGEAENSVERWKDMYLTKHEPKRGEWVGVNPMVDSVQCSICGGQLFSAELETPYCPYCGARMEVQE